MSAPAVCTVYNGSSTFTDYLKSSTNCGHSWAERNSSGCGNVILTVQRLTWTIGSDDLLDGDRYGGYCRNSLQFLTSFRNKSEITVTQDQLGIVTDF